MCTQRLSPKASSTAPAQNPYKLDDAHTGLDNKDRVYAGVNSENLFITGDANGYDKTDKNVFRIYLGSSIGDINISKDETRLIVSTYAGFVAMYDLTCREKIPAPNRNRNGQRTQTLNVLERPPTYAVAACGNVCADSGFISGNTAR